ncbi:hypothetical protein ACQ86N_13390 [Puia sp. P3]|uniref:hypothetical protein n=1 Tax=Puia sp. P3 TaxID=3423952 RepID=UPI003D677B57
MKKRTWKRIALAALGVFVLGVVVLAVHIYVVTRPRVDSDTRVMVRIDLRKDIGQAEADTITAWLYQQKGSTMFWSTLSLISPYLRSRPS